MVKHYLKPSDALPLFDNPEWGTGQSFSEHLILALTNPQYDKRLFIDLPALTRKLQAHKMCRYIVFVFTFKTIYVHNMFWACIFM